MIRHMMICAALLLGTPAAAQGQGEETPAGDPLAPQLVDSRSDPMNFDLARRKVVDCEGERFVFAWGAGSRPTKVTLCSEKNATREDLIEMLEDATTKLEQSNIAEDRRIAIVQQIRAKIAELQGSSDAASSPQTALGASLLKLPPADTIPSAALPPAITAQTTTAPPVLRPVEPAARPAQPPKPQLSFECDSPATGRSSGPCTFLRPDTRIIVTAEESLPEGTALRFRRKGETREEVALGALRKGQSVRIALPRKVCAGVFKTQAEIQIVRDGQVVDSVGPLPVRC